MDLADRILRIGETVAVEEFFSASTREAREFALGNPFAFLLATCLDRGPASKRIWSIPLDLRNTLGHLDPGVLAGMPVDEIRSVLQGIPHTPRWMQDAPRTVKEVACLVAKQRGGRASLVWEGRTAHEVKRDLLEIHGVGPNIAAMALLLIERAFAVSFEDLDHSQFDIKADVHTMRVLSRLGLTGRKDADQAIEAARRLNPSYPGALDAGLWLVGNRWCRAARPRCQECELTSLCPKVGLGETEAGIQGSCRRPPHDLPP